MLLEKLEIKGFKSFGDRVVLRFDQGITGVVGPNGSGKSNVVDAIRWVLGEQSAKTLRSDKMDNVIFNGSKKRKPLQMAEVILTFRNHKGLLPTEYTEVSIGRRYYRSGDGEYLLNGVTCRLKDIQGLFMDTGIGSDSYAIIELKMVDEILNDVNNARRTIFEEAAGVAKFKKRKKEALSKLSGTDEDLARVEDLVYEIEKNMRSLERQAKQAERYLRLRDEYKGLSVQLAALTIARLQGEFKELKARLTEARDAKAELDAKLAKESAAIEETKAGLGAKEEHLSDRQKALNEQQGRIRKYESEKNIRSERTKNLQEKLERLEAQMGEDSKSNQRVRFSLESLDKEKNQLEIELTKQERDLGEAKIELDNTKAETEEAKITVQKQNKQIEETRQQTYQTRKTQEINQVQIETLQKQIEEETSEASEKQDSLGEFDKRINALVEEIRIKQADQLKTQSRQEEVKHQIGQHEDALQTLREAQAKTHRELDAKKHEHSMTKSMLENLEGYPKAIKFLKKDGAMKQTPLLSDIITCDEAYRVAIESYLESYLNHFVVDQGDSALKAINLLNDSGNGRAHFLLNNRFASSGSMISKTFENAIPALQVVEYEDQYGGLVDHLLSSVYVVTDKQDRIPQDPDCIFITQNGKIVAGKNSISGGSVGLFQGKKLGRAKNLEKLAEVIKELTRKNTQIQGEINTHESKLGKLKAEKNDAVLFQLRDAISRLEKEQAALQARKEQSAKFLKDRIDKDAAAREKIKELEASSAQLQPEIEKLDAQLEKLTGDKAQLESRLVTVQETQTKASAAYNEFNIRFHQQKNKLQSITNEIGYKQQSFDSSKARIENNQAEQSTTLQAYKQLQSEAGSGEEELTQLYEGLEKHKQELSQSEAFYFDARNQINEAEKALSTIRSQREEATDRLQETQQHVSQTELQVATTQERISVEFEVSLEELKGIEPEEELDEEELQGKVQSIKEKVDKFGPVNHTAIEAYNEIKDRHDFITEQKADLVEAKESLLKTIQEIDAVAREKFLVTFTQARENFIKVFQTLFNEGDTCDLVLAEPEDPLQCKIEILARPKGKRPLSINQLSGGEKTLTATALLFAIYLIKPAPFCIFDEVDAPLDDANIDKFNKIIREFSKESQFIIVTHNKRTMAAADVMYGITMAEQALGVSTVVPVDLGAVDQVIAQ